MISCILCGVEVSNPFSGSKKGIEVTFCELHAEECVKADLNCKCK